MAGVGYLFGIVLGVVLYVLVAWMEDDYYKRKHEVIRRKLAKLDQAHERQRAAKSDRLR